jgi:hypothetical protein
VAAHAIVGSSTLDAAGLRLLGLQRALVASTTAEIEAAAADLAGTL